MKFAILKETAQHETRVAITPEIIKRLTRMNCEIHVQTNAGHDANIFDNVFKEAGAYLHDDVQSTLENADVILKVRAPSKEEVKQFPANSKLFCLMKPYQNQDILQACADNHIDTFALELMPRISRAQSMDILSSQSNLAGYRAVIEAVHAYGRAMPMMMTAAGTVSAARVFVMGAGVAGLQAIATARRLGAIVTATDVRPAVKEQVASLGAEFIAVEDEEFKAAESSGGYAKEMSQEYQDKQRDLITTHIAKQDIIITTALIPGRPAPKLISMDMLQRIKPGSVVVDMAVEQGGNIEQGTKEGVHVTDNNVTILGIPNMAGKLAADASNLFARNIFAFISPMINQDNNTLDIDDSDALISATRLTHRGDIVHADFKNKNDDQHTKGKSKS